jgi:peptide chain release factor 1
MDPGTRIAGLWDKRGENDYRIEWFSGSGAGGQHRNKHQNSCRLIHIPTGTIEARQGRDRVSNQFSAKRALDDRLDMMATGATATAVSLDRKAMVGTGMRGDKIRTIRIQADEAVDHRTGKRTQASKYLRGFMNDLW